MKNSLLKCLIGKFRAQDMTAFSLIYDEFKRLIYLYSGRLCDDDSVQDLTLFLIELLYSIDISRFTSDNSDSLKRYIAVSLKNKYIALSKEGEQYKKMCGEFYDGLYFTQAPPKEEIELVEALECLTSRQKIIIIYKYIYCLSDSEISNRLGISRQAVNRLKNRALITLKQFYFQTEGK